MERFSDFKFTITYHAAADVRELVIRNAEEDYMLDYFLPVDEQFELRALSPQKISWLYDLVQRQVSEGYDYTTRKVGDEDVVLEWQSHLKDYGIDYYSEEQYISHLTEGEGNNYVGYLEHLIQNSVVDRIADETVSILFADREFLLHFNLLVSKIVQGLKKKDHPVLLSKDGIVNRCKYWPEWVKNAVFYRERGRCALCQKDISGLLVAGTQDAIDHIVPLKQGGTNDVTNLQLLCPDCNRRKGGGEIRTSSMYAVYW